MDDEEILITYVFYHKNSSAVMTLSSVCFDNASMDLHDLVEDSEAWRCDDEDGIKEN
jgi:hypothetical protein